MSDEAHKLVNEIIERKRAIEDAIAIAIAIGKIADALGTAEVGPALIEVARNAHRAEQREAHFLRLAQNGDYSIETAYQKVYGDWKD